MLYLTVDEHIEVVKRLKVKAEKILVNFPKIHKFGIEYTSLMNCFLLHNLSCVESLIHLLKSFSKDWFPVAVGYTIVRPMFEIDVNSHYISKKPIEFSKQYIAFEKINRYKNIEAIRSNLNSKISSWKEGLNLFWKSFSKEQLNKIKEDYENALSIYDEDEKKKRKKYWSGKSLKEMAIEVEHKEAYEIFYSDLSKFTHVNVDLAYRYLKLNPEKIMWSSKSSEIDISSVFRYAAIFLTCFMELYGKKFMIWNEVEINKCWIF